MSIKIIQPGQLKSSDRTTTCVGCGCIFSFNVRDAELITDFRDGDYYQILCPHTGCNQVVTVAA